MEQKRSPVFILSFDFGRYYWITMRPYLLFVSGITGIAGLSFAPQLPFYQTAILIIVFFFSYGFGQALTDCFQIDTDTISSPYRPLTQGIIKKSDVLIISLLGLICIGITLALFNITNLILCTLAILGLATYTWFKRRWWGGPFYNAWIVSLLCFIAFLAGGGNIIQAGISFYLLLLAVLFAYANFVLSGYFKDISADRKTGYNTLPVRYNLMISKIVSDFFALLSVLLCFVIIVRTINHDSPLSGIILALIIFAAGSAMAFWAQLRLHKVFHEDQAHKAISLVVHAYILLLASVTVIQKPALFLFLGIFYGGFVLSMKIRPMKEQI
jgi:4-hydroxybenzoate polyprenyltransferase